MNYRFFGLLGLLSFLNNFVLKLATALLFIKLDAKPSKKHYNNMFMLKPFETGWRRRCCFLLFLMLNFADWFGNFQLFPFQLQLCFSRAKQSSAISFLKASKASRSFKLIFNWIRKLSVYFRQYNIVEDNRSWLNASYTKHFNKLIFWKASWLCFYQWTVVVRQQVLKQIYSFSFRSARFSQYRIKRPQSKPSWGPKYPMSVVDTLPNREPSWFINQTLNNTLVICLRD